jgi:iron complex transport system substrate-binding protein
VRIVSLIASATEIVDALGLGAQQVGRSHECDYPESVLQLPVCTAPAFLIEGSSADIDRRVKQRLANAVSVYEIFPDILERLKPSHIITQTQCRVCAVSLEDVERALAASVSSRPQVVPLEPNSLADIWTDIVHVASAGGIAPEGERLVASLRHRMEGISRLAHSSPRRPRVACIEWHEPLMAAGNWVPELVQLAGAENLLGSPGVHSPYLSWEQLSAADPDVIVSMPCGFDLARTRAELYWLTDNPAWPKLRAVREGQVYIADGNQFFNRPGPRVVESLEILGQILHPELFPPTLENTAWERIGAARVSKRTSQTGRE